MEGTIFIVHSMTEAMKGKRILSQNGIKSEVKRISSSNKNRGCGYGLHIKEKIFEAEKILRINNITEDDLWR